MPVVLLPHAALFFVQTGFLGFQVLGFARSELTALYAVRDPILLVFFSILNGWSRSAGRRGGP